MASITKKDRYLTENNRLNSVFILGRKNQSILDFQKKKSYNINKINEFKFKLYNCQFLCVEAK